MSEPGREPEQLEEVRPRRGWVRVLRVIFGLAVAGIFAVALSVIRRELAAYPIEDVLAAVRALGWQRVVLAVVLVAVSYLCLSGYDVLAVRTLRAPIGTGRAMFAAWLATAFTNSVGFGGLGGASIRYRLYGTWGLGLADVSRVLMLVAIGFWTGFALVAGPALLLEPGAAFSGWALAWVVRPLGLGLTGLGLVYLAVVLLWRRPIRVRGFALPLPRPTLVPFQIVVSVADWFAASSVLWTLLPSDMRPALPIFLGLFLLAQLAGLLSHVPGGLGVFEAIVLGGLASDAPGVAASLLVYRGAYYLLPLVLGAATLSVREALAHRRVLGQAATAVGQVAGAVLPQFVTAMVFLGGVVLLLSSATPILAGRMGPLGGGGTLLAFSHLLTSVIGASLLLLARGLQRRLDSAWLLASALLAAGVVLSALKVEAALATGLIVMLAMVLVARPHFHRRGSLLAQPFTVRWVTGIALAILGSVWLGLFAHRHAGWAELPWWRFAFDPQAPTAGRAALGAALAVFFFGIGHLLAPGRHRPPAASAEELARARPLIAAAGAARAWLAFLGDKTLLFDPEGRGLILYGVSGRTFVALGDPVGPREVRAELIRRFRARAHREGGRAVFYEVGRDDLDLYLDAGFSLVKLGEEARVDVRDFTLEGHAWAALRTVRRQLQRAGCRVEIVAPGAAEDVLPELRRISDAWLTSKKTREKRFSMGRFDPRYLSHLPLAVVRCDDRPVAFASLWPGQEELEVDLMRYAPEAPKNVMEFLLVELMLYAHAEGHRWFNLGMAPFAGLEGRPPAPLWHRLGAFLFRHGERFYGFEGLRRYKEKFHPQWEPRYLAVPRTTTVPRVLADATRLISGGLSGLVRR